MRGQLPGARNFFTPSQVRPPKAQKVERALCGLNLPEPARARIEALGMRIANKLLHGPTTALREADGATRTAIQRMFGLN